MESANAKQVLVLRQGKPEPATLKQVRYIRGLANDLGFQVNTDTMSKDEATKRIELLKKIQKSEKQQKFKENEVKLAMVKKLIYKRWVAKDKEINKQTEGVFMREVYYINKVFSKIDELILSKQAA